VAKEALDLERRHTAISLNPTLDVKQLRLDAATFQPIAAWYIFVVARGISNDGVSDILLDAAKTAPGFGAWQAVVFEAMEEVGYDVAFVKVLPPVCGFASRGFERGLLERAQIRWPHYRCELQPLNLAAQRDGVATDNEILGSGRRRLNYYRDIVQPQRGTSSLLAHLSIAGRTVGALLLGRTGGVFKATDLARVRQWLAPLSLGAAAMAWHTSPAQDRLIPRVSPREGEVLRLVQLGYTNPEIAHALGTSPNTVRNQVSSLLQKLDASTRAELVGLTVRP
jgi:DNA-binding CsgD family transcriptional regulator